MNKTYLLLLVLLNVNLCLGQDYGDLPKIKKELLLEDLDILYQGLDQFHSGMYWFTSKDSVDLVFKQARNKVSKDLNVLEFHKIVAPLVGLSREGHTGVYLPQEIKNEINKNSIFLPLTFVFLDKKLYCLQNGSEIDQVLLLGKEVVLINGEKPKEIIEKIGSLFTSDGFIKGVKYNELYRFNFSKYYYYYYGNIPEHKLKLKETNEEVVLKALKIDNININLGKRYPAKKGNTKKFQDVLEYEVLNDSIVYLGIHSFSNDKIKERSKEKSLDRFLEKSFETISRRLL